MHLAQPTPSPSSAETTSILFLISHRGIPANDNHSRIARAARQLGIQVSIADHASLEVRDRTLLCVVQEGRRLSLSQFTWIWCIGFGERQTFLDRAQLLRCVDRGQFVNSAEALLRLHGKGALMLNELGTFFPETVISSNSGELLRSIQEGGRWVLKPSAGSYGRGVVLVDNQTRNLEELVRLTLNDGYAVLQEFVDSPREHRWLVANGEVLGSYQKRKRNGMLGSLEAGAQPVKAHPTGAETSLARSIARRLPALGIRFATLDCLGDCLLDMNFVNPGWLQTFEKITGEDLTCRAIRFLLSPPDPALGG